MTLREIINDALEEYKQRRLDSPDEENVEVIAEIADSAVPVYHHDLLELAMDDLSTGLATDEPDVWAFDGKHTPVNGIAGNVYQAVSEALNNAGDPADEPEPRENE